MLILGSGEIKLIHPALESGRYLISIILFVVTL